MQPTMSRRQMLQAVLALSVPATLLAACSSGGPSTHAAPASTAATPGALDGSDAREAVTAASVADLAAVVTGMRDYALALQTAAAGTGNWSCSPLSMDAAFGMLRAGARKDTATQIDRVFGFPTSSDPAGSPHRALNALTAAVTATGGTGPTVSVADGVFVDEKFQHSVAQAFLQILRQQYGASPQVVSFASAQAATLIDNWVSTQTRGKITRLFDRLDPDARMVLANAVYLDAKWASPFDPGDTVTLPFTTTGSSVQVPTMRQVTTLKYTTTPAWMRVSLPYAGGDYTMRLVLPGQSGTTALGMALSGAMGDTSGDSSVSAQLAIPRWTSDSSIDLRSALIEMGMSDAFSESAADFSGISASKLYVGQAIHRATVEVGEKGTVAAAVTGMEMRPTAGFGGLAISFDRPFAWAIVHEPTQTPVFAGQVVDPSRV